jgi:hypothetical protein
VYILKLLLFSLPMHTASKISLSPPHSEISSSYFSFQIKQNLEIERCEYPEIRKLYVVSDIEGNFSALVKLLYQGKVVNKHMDWIFEDGHLVIVGDCFDRGEEVIECLWLIYSLEEKARKRGGYVHFILGNHEIMNMNGDWRYVHPKYAIKKASSSHQTTALYGGNVEIWRWLQTKNIIEKIGSVLFVHAGISEEILGHNIELSKINNLCRPWYRYSNRPFTDPLLETVFSSESSPFWYRGYYTQDIKEEIIDETLRRFKVNTIVTGHTLVEHISSFYSGKVINVNTNHSFGKSEALYISGRKFYRVNTQGEKNRVK